MNKQQLLNRFFLQKSIAFKATSFQTDHTKALKKAAILMPIVERKNGLHIVLTQRALHLKHHAGQISFPGGKFETTDQSLQHTALRETEEEIGIQQSAVELIGSLPALSTNTGYHISPFIGFFDPQQRISIDQGEVKTCFEVPMDFILNKQHFAEHAILRKQQLNKIYTCVYQGHLIWGATAQMLINLQDHISPINALK